MSFERPAPLQSSSKRFPLKLLSKLKRTPKKKVFIIGGIALICIAGVLISSAIPLKGNVVTVHPSEFSRGFTEEAQVQAINESSLYNSVDGKIAAIHVQNGDAVTKGQVLIELETQDLQSQVDVLKAQLTSLEGQLQQASHPPQPALIQQQNLLISLAEQDLLTQEKALERSKSLYEAGAISLSAYEEAQHQTEKAKNYLEQQKLALQLLYEQGEPASGTGLYFSGQREALNTQIRQLEDKIQKSKVVAPQDGIVKDLTFKTGMVASSGQLLLSIAPDQGYHLESYILASDALDVKAGSPVKVIQETSAGNLSLTGKVESVDPSAVERISPLGLKENRVKVMILLESNTPVVLGSSMDVQFVTHQEDNRLVVPKSALFPFKDGQALWVIRDGKASVQPVVKGLENNNETIIEQGIQEGDQILLDPDLKGLKEGKRVQAA
ncbi:efflux RND transporter periplasmic adaptor subunit [Desulfitobacterium sp.]|uniref:efflux RND transporter periplasmic adaptor subunit n=1 Tax=Desulfitobacterium sp. TaxID=49981 RepID=UPI002B202C36|nr:HlyD family efflux transporter periplasmic adaptor subunit [Desulfitobacterium sp.]MEA4901030.1 HlyD family efflux transporter periplasmic adaptor subunit [Desulfitobacterium sp.]